MCCCRRRPQGWVDEVTGSHSQGARTVVLGFLPRSKLTYSGASARHETVKCQTAKLRLLLDRRQQDLTKSENISMFHYELTAPSSTVSNITLSDTNKISHLNIRTLQSLLLFLKHPELHHQECRNQERKLDKAGRLSCNLPSSAASLLPSYIHAVPHRRVPWH